MALSKSTITGRVPLPSDENLQFAELTFALSGLDTEGASVLPGGVSTRIVLIDSDIPAGFELWQNTAGLHGTHYRVLARWTVKDRDGVREQYADLGVIQIGSDPSYTLADLINNGVLPAIGTFWSAITQAQYDAVIQAAADAQASAADRVQTGLDATATAADRVQTGADRTAAQVARGEAVAAAAAAEADAVATAADRAAIEAQADQVLSRVSRAPYESASALLADATAWPTGTALTVLTGLEVDVVVSGGQAVTAGGVQVKERALHVPYLEQTTKALQLLPWAMRDDVLSGAMALDHTAAVTAILGDANLRRCLEFPAGGTFNLDWVRLPVGLVSKEIIFGGSTFKQRADRTSGGQFLRLMQPTGIGAYGFWDNMRLEGGVFDLNNRVQWAAIAWLPYMRASVVRDLTVIHRTIALTYVSLDVPTDVLTAAAHSFQNGDGLVLEGNGGYHPGGHPGTATRFFVINRTTDAFQLSLTPGGAVHNFTSWDDTPIFVQPYVNWGIVAGGRNVEIENPNILNGANLFQDGLHIVHGRGISVIGGYSESGDDALALGFEVEASIPDLEIRDVTVAGLRVKSNRASAVKVYVPAGSGRTVIGAEITVVGQSGIMRNGGIAINGGYGNPLTDEAPIRDINIRANLTLGSPGRTDNATPFIASFNGCNNVNVSGDFRFDGYQFGAITSGMALDCTLKGHLSGQTSNPASDINLSTTRGITNALPPIYVAPVVEVVLPNLLANPWGSGGTSSNVPTGWRPSGGNNGLTMTLLYSEPDDDGFRKVAYRLAGTTTANSTAILCPNANSAVAFDPAKAAVSFKWGVQIEGAVPAGMTITLAVAGLASDGNTILENTDLGIAMMVGRSMERFEVSRTMINAGTEFLRGQLAYVIPTGSVVDLVIWTHQPMLTED